MNGALIAFAAPLIESVEGLWQALNGYPTEWVIPAAVLATAMALSVLRTVVTLALRAVGLSRPSHYRLWPRLPWRSVLKLRLALSLWVEHVFRHGKKATGGFASAWAVMTLLYTPRKVFLGRLYAWGFGLLQPVGMSVSRHIFCYAMTGAGKTTWLISMVSQWRGSVFLIDPKNQVTAALRRNDWRTWVVFAPYGDESDGFNIFDDIKAAIVREGETAAVKWATRAAHALVVTPDGSRQPYFTDTARGFVVGLILHVLTFHEEDDHNLGFVRDLIVHGYRVYSDDGKRTSTREESREVLLRLMDENSVYGGAVAGGAAALNSAGGDTGGNVLSTLQEQTKWLDLPSVRHMVSFTTRPISDLKTRDDVVFALTAPVLSIRQELKPLIRVFTNFSAYTFESVQQKKGQCLKIVDELQAQGYNETIEVGLPVARSYGETFVGIAQDEEGMKAAYPKTYRAFTGNADAVLWMATEHPSNTEALSKALGQKTNVDKERYSRRKSYRNVPVMDQDQVRRFLEPESGNIIVTRAGKRAIKLKNDPYYKALPVTQYDADPDHGDALLRRITRFFFNRRAG